jgi:hypothetical protein
VQHRPRPLLRHLRQALHLRQRRPASAKLRFPCRRQRRPVVDFPWAASSSARTRIGAATRGLPRVEATCEPASLLPLPHPSRRFRPRCETSERRTIFRSLRVVPKLRELLGNQAYSERDRDHITHRFAGATRFSVILRAKSKAAREFFVPSGSRRYHRHRKAMPGASHAAATSPSPFPNKASTKSSA